MANAPQYPIESVGNALRILMMLGGERELRTSDVAKRLGVAPSTGHRLLSMLQHFELAEQDERTKGYRAGPALIELGVQVLEAADPSRSARRLLDELADRTEETVSVAILRGTETLIINSVESSRAVRVGSLVGARYPAHLAAVGKVLLAELPDDRLAQLYPSGAGADHPPAATITTDLRGVRKLGYAVNTGQTRDEVGAVAVAIRDSEGWARSSLGLSMPLSRFRKNRVQELLPLLRDTARSLGARAW